MGRTVDELAAAMPLEEFMGHYRDYLAGELLPITLGDMQVCATVANFAGMRMKEGKTLSPADFNPFRDAMKQEVSGDPPDEAIMNAFGIT